MLYGAGQLILLSKDLNTDSLRGENLVHPLCISQFELTAEDNNLEARCLKDGQRVIRAAFINETISTLTLTFEYADWQTLQVAFDELAANSSNISLPLLKSAFAVDDGVDSADIADSDIVGTEVINEDIYVYVAGKGSWGDRKYLLASEVTVVAGGLELDQSYAGAPIEYTVNKSYTSIETIGLEANYDKFGKLVFVGKIYGTEFGNQGMGIIVPELSRISTPQLSVTGDLAELTVEFRASVPAGKRRAFELYNISTATV